ncbi:hypothetical protein APHAL10511_007591 [Amanita phalloides]|nr:hypothetical protein APHAL10511_007591 [Amanita phalloides]
MTKRHHKRVPQLRSRQTRSSKGRTLLSDPAESTQALNLQLAALGLYAVQTLGDGNCLFRALSDQSYGSDSKHVQVRQDVCDWIASHKSRYGPFVDDERGIDTHLQCMRQQGTYGGHMELSAFAHLTRRDIKVIQPGLVYVIEWNAGGDPDDFLQADHAHDNSGDARERRRQRRERMKEKHHQDDEQDPPLGHSTMYVAYYDWEHFSSIRNLRGPHSGLPYVSEAAAVEDADADLPLSKHAQKANANVKRVKLKLGLSSAPLPSHASMTPSKFSPKSIKPSVPTRDVSSTDPLTIPLPNSRSPSPISVLSSLSPSPAPYPLLYAESETTNVPRTTRSPKRNFDESSDPVEAEDGDEYGSEVGTKRARLGSRSRGQDDEHMEVDCGASDDGEGEDGSPGPSARPPASTISASSDMSSTTSSITSVSSSSPSPPPTFHKQNRVSLRAKQTSMKDRPLTRRQRKAMGLIDKKSRQSAGVIVIPAGKRQAADADVGAGAEWLRNGNGRVDVRGFRELKI